MELQHEAASRLVDSGGRGHVVAVQGLNSQVGAGRMCTDSSWIGARASVAVQRRRDDEDPPLPDVPAHSKRGARTRSLYLTTLAD